MIRRLERFALAVLLWVPVPAVAAVRLLTGEVRAIDAQQVTTPASNSSPVVLRYFLPEGSRVRAGDVVVRIDPGEAAGRLRQIESEIGQARAKAAKEVAELKVKAVDAELAEVDAGAALETARVDASIPRQLVSGLDYDRYQGERDRAERELALKKRELAAARGAIDRREEDGKLEVAKLVAEHDSRQKDIERAEVRADRDGVIVHAFNSMSEAGGRYEEGSSSFPGQKIGEVVGAGRLAVRAYASEPDRVGLGVGQTVALSFDALPGPCVQGHITSVAGAPASKSEWGDGRYYPVDIDLPGQARSLRPGMSVRVIAAVQAPAAGAGGGPHSIVSANPASAACSSGSAPMPPRATSVLAEGEVVARRSAVIAPPTIEGLWMLNITQLAPDGVAVKQGDPVAGFDGGQLATNLVEKQSQLKEKQSERADLLLDIDERARTQRLATEEARANLDKARRKASQPKEFIAGIEYRKLLVGFQQAQSRMALVQQREALAAEARDQERHLADGQVGQLQDEVATLGKSVAALNVVAPRAGLMLHGTDWQGQKFDVGSRVFRGMSIASIPDMDSLAVRADVAERDMARLAPGATVRVRLEGGIGTTVNGSLVEIGRVVHSKSSVQPVPVVDVLIALAPGSAKWRPGQPVRVEIAAVGTGKP